MGIPLHGEKRTDHDEEDYSRHFRSSVMSNSRLTKGTVNGLTQTFVEFSHLHFDISLSSRDNKLTTFDTN